MIKCGCCSKEIKNRKNICFGCGRPVCFLCDVRGKCKECLTIANDKQLVHDYFKEKYVEATKTVL